MNLFGVEYDPNTGRPCPVRSAQATSDEHFKIIIEAVQMMVTAFALLHSDEDEWSIKILTYAQQRWSEFGHSESEISKRYVPRPTHKGHPMTRWVSYSAVTFQWTANHALELCKERLRRPLLSGKLPDYHQYRPYIEWFVDNTPTNFENEGWIDMPLCMDDEYKVDEHGVELDSVKAYRQWVISKHNTFHPITTRRKKPKRRIDWRRCPDRKPNWVITRDNTNQPKASTHKGRIILRPKDTNNIKSNSNIRSSNPFRGLVFKFNN